jgi:predicted ABC-type transport system involved in lysophospholipase L1 biosynthesis ATPase subunit
VFDPLPALCLAHGLLLDEPFGALDALTRAHLQDAVMHIQQELNTTIVVITHDVDEAVLLRQRARDANPLFHTAGDLPRPFVQRVPHLYSL